MGLLAQNEKWGDWTLVFDAEKSQFFNRFLL
jgi:hypothetical protein